MAPSFVLSPLSAQNVVLEDQRLIAQSMDRRERGTSARPVSPLANIQRVSHAGPRLQMVRVPIADGLRCPTSTVSSRS